MFGGYWEFKGLSVHKSKDDCLVGIGEFKSLSVHKSKDACLVGIGNLRVYQYTNRKMNVWWVLGI